MHKAALRLVLSKYLPHLELELRALLILLIQYLLQFVLLVLLLHGGLLLLLNFAVSTHTLCIIVL